MKQSTDNFRKHTSTNPLQRYLINNFTNTLITLVKPLKTQTILDIGCGEGFMLSRLYEEKIGSHLEGIDSLKTAIDIGKKIHPQLTLKQGSIYDLPYKDNSFDLVLCTEVLEHLENPTKARKELVRVAKTYLLLSVPNEPIFRLSNFLRGKNLSRWGNDIEHINHWSSRGFVQFVTKESVILLNKKQPFPWTMLLLEKKK